MIVLVLAALRSGHDIEINWVGRLAIWPTMMGVGGALITDWWGVEALLYVGITGAILASLLYLRAGVRVLAARER
jgi:hypothetical protein